MPKKRGRGRPKGSKNKRRPRPAPAPVMAYPVESVVEHEVEVPVYYEVEAPPRERRPTVAERLGETVRQVADIYGMYADYKLSELKLAREEQSFHWASARETRAQEEFELGKKRAEQQLQHADESQEWKRREAKHDRQKRDLQIDGLKLRNRLNQEKLTQEKQTTRQAGRQGQLKTSQLRQNIRFEEEKHKQSLRLGRKAAADKADLAAAKMDNDERLVRGELRILEAKEDLTKQQAKLFEARTAAEYQQTRTREGLATAKMENDNLLAAGKLRILDERVELAKQQAALFGARTEAVNQGTRDSASRERQARRLEKQKEQFSQGQQQLLTESKLRATKAQTGRTKRVAQAQIALYEARTTAVQEGRAPEQDDIAVKSGWWGLGRAQGRAQSTFAHDPRFKNPNAMEFGDDTYIEGYHRGIKRKRAPEFTFINVPKPQNEAKPKPTKKPTTGVRLKTGVRLAPAR